MRKFNVTVNGIGYEVCVEEVGATDAPAYVAPAAVAAPVAPKAPVAAPVAPKAAAVVAPAGGTKLDSPMPGTILKIKVKNGDTVNKGDVIFILEAMKMENDVVAPTAGKITITTSEGASVSSGDTLAVIA